MFENNSGDGGKSDNGEQMACSCAATIELTLMTKRASVRQTRSNYLIDSAATRDRSAETARIVQHLFGCLAVASVRVNCELVRRDRLGRLHVCVRFRLPICALDLLFDVLLLLLSRIRIASKQRNTFCCTTSRADVQCIAIPMNDLRLLLLLLLRRRRLTRARAASNEIVQTQ